MAIAVGSTVCDRYEILQELGEGGFARVYKARDLELRRIVALKLMKLSGVQSDKDLARFQQEAKFLARLRHPNIVQVFAFEIVDDSYPCIVMEFLEGQSLASYLSDNAKMAEDTLIHVLLQICSGLSYAHQLGFVHRDLTASNIIMIGDPEICEVKIIDFGLSKIFGDAQNTLTQTGFIIGTPAYMSPELIRSQKVDHRADIYSLGCVIYEALSGKKAFKSDSPIGFLNVHQYEYPVEPSSGVENSQTNKQLGQIALRCLQKEPDHRFASCDEIADSLHLNNARDWPKDIHPWALASIRTEPFPNLWQLACIMFALALIGAYVILGKSRNHLRENLESKPSKVSVLRGHYIDIQRTKLVQALEQAEKRFGTSSSKTLEPIAKLIEFYGKNREWAEYEDLAKRQLGLREREHPTDVDALISSIDVLASSCEMQHKNSEAESLYRRSLSLSENGAGRKNSDITEHLYRLASCLSEEHKYTEAELLLKRALTLKEKTSSNNPEAWAIATSRLAKLYETQLRYAEAESLYKKAVSISKQSLNKNRLRAESVNEFYRYAVERSGGNLYWSYIDLATFYLRHNSRIDDAVSAIMSAKALSDEFFGPNNSGRLWYLMRLSWACRLQGNLKEAERLSQQSFSFIKQCSTSNDNDNDNDRAASSYELAATYLAEKRFTEAGPLFKQAMQYLEKSRRQDGWEYSLAKSGWLESQKLTEGSRTSAGTKGTMDDHKKDTSKIDH